MRGKDYFPTFDTKMCTDLLKDQEYKREERTDLWEKAQAAGIDYSDDYRQWEDMSHSIWTAAKEHVLPEQNITLIVLFGKYCAHEEKPLEVVKMSTAAKFTLFDVYKATKEVLDRNESEVYDGQFLVGFSVYGDGIYLSNLEA
jgi:hypothetical protein